MNAGLAAPRLSGRPAIRSHQKGTTMTNRRRRLRDASKVCPVFMKLSNGLVISRCELDAGHDGPHKDGCTRWGNPQPTAHR